MEEHRNDRARSRRRAWEGYLLAGICLANLLITAAMLLTTTSPALAGLTSAFSQVVERHP